MQKRALPLLSALHPLPGHYQGYLYCYDLRQQRMTQKEAPVGRVTYAGGEEQTFTDAQKFLDTIREELPYQATTGFRFEMLADDPAVRKAADDLLLDFAGEENPRRACNYGMTETGKQALREAADPDRPHTYAWFVMTDCNTPDEQIHRDLTLEDAVRLYRDSTRPEKRLGVTKDRIATVDFLREVDGEQVFFQDHRRMDSFRDDPEIFEAVQLIHRELEWEHPRTGHGDRRFEMIQTEWLKFLRSSIPPDTGSDSARCGTIRTRLLRAVWGPWTTLTMPASSMFAGTTAGRWLWRSARTVSVSCLRRHRQSKFYMPLTAGILPDMTTGATARSTGLT